MALLKVKPLITSIVVVNAPWPVSPPVPVEQMPHYRAALALVDEGAKGNRITPAPGRFQAGWAKVELTPPVGAPLAGYGARDGAPSTGIHDPLFVKALAVGDGDDTAVIVGADTLVVPENSGELAIRMAAWAEQTHGADLWMNSFCGDYIGGGSHDPSGFGPVRSLILLFHAHVRPGLFVELLPLVPALARKPWTRPPGGIGLLPLKFLIALPAGERERAVVERGMNGTAWFAAMGAVAKAAAGGDFHDVGKGGINVARRGIP